MRALSVAFVLIVGLLARPVLGADAPVATPGAVVPYDAPDTAAPAPTPVQPVPVQPAPAVKPAPPVPPRAPQVYDSEAPRRWQPPPTAVQPLVASPSEPSEAGLIVGESLLAFLTVTTELVVAFESTPWFVVAGPLLTGGLVCGIGSTSSSYDGSCGAAIGSAYLGSLLAVPLAFLAGGSLHSDADVIRFAAFGLLGYLAGTTVGAVVGWNSSRKPKDRLVADAGRLDAIAAARGAPWREALLPRGGASDGGAPRFTAPVVAFRF
jgi:hypothetical protein